MHCVQRPNTYRYMCVCSQCACGAAFTLGEGDKLVQRIASEGGGGEEKGKYARKRPRKRD